MEVEEIVIAGTADRKLRKPVRWEFVCLARNPMDSLGDCECTPLVIPSWETAQSCEYPRAICSIGGRKNIGVLDGDVNNSSVLSNSIEVVAVLQVERQDLFDHRASDECRRQKRILYPISQELSSIPCHQGGWILNSVLPLEQR